MIKQKPRITCLACWPPESGWRMWRCTFGRYRGVGFTPADAYANCMKAVKQNLPFAEVCEVLK